MSEQISLNHLGQNVSITGTVRTEEGWVDGLTVEGVVSEVKAYLTDAPNATPQGCQVTLYREDEENVVVRFDPTAQNVDVL